MVQKQVGGDHSSRPRILQPGEDVPTNGLDGAAQLHKAGVRLRAEQGQSIHQGYHVEPEPR